MTPTNRHELQTMSLNRLKRDDAFRLSYPLQPMRFVDIATRLPGIPLLVANRDHQLICGHDLLSWLKKRGHLQALVLEVKLDKKEALLFAYHYKDLLAGFNLYERLVFLQKILPLTSPGEIQNRIPLGFPISAELSTHLQKLLAPAFKQLLMSDRLCLKTLLRLLKTTAQNRQVFLELLQRVPFNENQQMKILELLEEIAFRNRLDWKAVIRRAGIHRWWNREMPQKRIVQSLLLLRYPEYGRFQDQWRQRYEKRFAKKGVRVSSHPFFEKEEIELSFRCPDIQHALDLLALLPVKTKTIKKEPSL